MMTYSSTKLTTAIKTVSIYATETTREITRRPAIVLIGALMVMVLSTPTVIFVNLAVAQGVTPLADITTRDKGDTSRYYSSLRLSETSSPLSSSSIPTIQAALPQASFRSTDIVNSNSIYEIVLLTTTTGVIHTIEIAFPAGTGISAAGVVERVGIGPGSLTKSGSTIVFHVANPEVIPAGTYIRLEMVDVKNPPTPSSNYKITVITRGPNNVVIDGPSTSVVYTIKQIGAAEIGPDSIVPFVVERNSETVSVPPLTFGFATAECLPNERVVGGGFQQIAGTGGGNLLQTFADKKFGNGWNVAMFNAEPIARSFFAKAECMPALP